ncbi:MAG TPA: cytochrome c oxidase subunit II [Candidatus Limnocylindria bacterium]|nr:cytochrome c oxidase subunit II [Candidatus Limnocylindria bacterium]
MWRRALLLAAAAAPAACGGDASTLDPAGPYAARIADLAWLMTGMSVLVVVLVAAFLGIALVRRSRPEIWREGRISDGAIIVGGGILLPALVLPLLWAVTLRDMRALTDAGSPPAVTIEITAHQWWYEIRYPEHGRTYRDEVFIPAGQTVLLRVTSSDVIHSLWIPRLNGKIDMIPGRINELRVEASRPGSYPVLCAEFCGLHHADMRMRVTAETPAAFGARMGGG